MATDPSNVDPNVAQQVASALAAQNQQFAQQTQLLTQLVAQMRVYTNSTQGATSGLETLAEKQRRATIEADAAGTQFNMFAEVLKESTIVGDKFQNMLAKHGATLQPNTIKITALAGAVDGFLGTWKVGFSLLQNVGRLFMTIGKSVVAVAKSIITFPFKMLRGLIHMSDQGGGNELAQALENIRKEFGYLNKTAGGAIVQMAKGMKGELAQTGLSVYRVFGTAAQRLEYFLEYAKNIGPVFDRAMHSVGEGGAEALGAYNKALGLTAEGQKAIASAAISSGQTVNEVNRQIANYSIQLSDAFGVTQKSVTRDVGNMMADVQHFGSLAPKELAQVAVYARRLGVEVKALTGIMDKFANFDQAAEAAARLSQAFGMNLDTLQMMKEQDPGRQMDMLRKAFFQTGRSIENMTRQERNYLAQTTGLDDAALKLAFSTKSQGMTYDQVTKKGDLAKRKQLSQAEAMEKLAGAIERMVQSGSGDGLGFIDKFFKGMEMGIRRSREFREIMINLRRTLRQTFYAGREVGAMFVQLFPGVKDFFKGLAGFFDPNKFKKMLGGVKTTFREFFRDLGADDPSTKRGAFGRFAESLKENFSDYFDSRSEAGRKFLNGAKAILTAFATIINSGFRMVLGYISETIPKIIQFIQTGGAGAGSLVERLRSSGGFFGPIFASLIDGIWPLLTQLFDQLKKLFFAAWNKLKPYVIDYGSKAMIAMLKASLVSAMIKGTGAAIFTAFGNWAVNGLFGAIKDKAPKAAQDAAGTLSEAVRRTADTASTAQNAGVANNAAQAIGGADQINNAAQRSSISKSGVVKLLGIALFIAVGVVAVLFAMNKVIMHIRKNHITTEEIIQAAIVMGAAGVTILAAGATAALLGTLPPTGGLKAVGFGLLALLAVILVMIGVAYLTTAAVRGFTISDVGKSVTIMGAIGVLFLAAGAVAVIAGLVGAAIIATGGTAALAIIAGLATLAVVIQQMSIQGMTIMNTIKAFDPGTGFKEKAEIFVSLIGAIGRFARDLGSVINVFPDGIFETIFGSSVNNIIGNLIDYVRAVGLEIRTLIDTIARTARDMDPEQIRRAKVIADILGAVGELMEKMKPATELFETSWFEDLVNPTLMQERLGEAATYIGNMGRQLKGIIELVTTQVNALQNTHFNERSLKAAELYTNILKGIGEFAGALTFGPETIRAIGEARKADRSQGDYMRGMQNFISGIIWAFTGSDFMDKVRLLVTNLIQNMSGMTTSQVQALKAVAPILGPLFTAIGTIAGMLKDSGRGTAGGTPNPEQIALLQARTQFVDTFLTRVGNFLPDIINRLKNITMTPAQGRSIKIGAEAIKSTMEGLKAMTEAFNALSGEPVSGGVATILPAMIRGVSSAISAMFPTTSSASGPSLMESLNTLDRGLQTMPTNLSAKVAALKGTFENLKTISQSFEAIQSLPQSLTQFTTNVRTDLITSVMSTLHSWVGTLNTSADEIVNAGGSIERINVAMSRISTGLGLSGRNAEPVTIRRGNLTISIPITVSLDGRELQGVLVNVANTTQPNMPRLQVQAATATNVSR